MASLGFLPMHQSSIDVFVARWGEYADVLHHLLRRPVVSVENPQVPQQYLSAVINAMALFAFDRNTGEIRGIVDEYVGLRDPGRPIPAGAVRVHGIRDCDVTGRRLDDGRVLRLICQAEFLVAHNEFFDRPFVERLYPEAVGKTWLCSMNGVPSQRDRLRDAGGASSWRGRQDTR